MATNGPGEMDEIDRIVLGILASNPRTPYSEISDRLEERGYQMSSEGIRYRAQNLFETTSTFFMIDPAEHNWLVLRTAITVVNEADAKERTVEMLREDPFWFISSGFGSFDIYAVATAPTTHEVDDLLNGLRRIECIADVEYFIETNRTIDISKYLPVPDSS
ncbi:Lrp/AsnC family transcriptional regulator [Halegenticoccus tardaugens]|uniref:Lrp/AsnC family transcriptional regulator n=1 Tax=Halegenticoccus tardaugens TaxID=2071624 RepID=UPI00100B2045|nr:Lrp/AsnC family transcriptional regulator [Halegenticoccus tardaugens]